MKSALYASVILALAAQAIGAQQFRLGMPVSDFAVHDMRGRTLTYKSLRGSVTVVVFFSTRCPISNAFNYRRNSIYRDFNKRAKFIAVDSNANETVEEVRAYAADVGFEFPVYKDVNNEVADRFGVLSTTDTFVIDASGVIQYHGYVEDALNPARTTKQALRLAIEAVLDGKPVTTPETRARGCAVRRAKP
jgi:peroxiredoxin